MSLKVSKRVAYYVVLWLFALKNGDLNVAELCLGVRIYNSKNNKGGS